MPFQKGRCDLMHSKRSEKGDASGLGMIGLGYEEKKEKKIKVWKDVFPQNHLKQPHPNCFYCPKRTVDRVLRLYGALPLSQLLLSTVYKLANLFLEKTSSFEII